MRESVRVGVRMSAREVFFLLPVSPSSLSSALWKMLLTVLRHLDSLLKK